MDPEYSVIGRVARRISAIALRDKYGANEHRTWRRFPPTCVLSATVLTTEPPPANPYHGGHVRIAVP
jgi:hypothetical protein